MATRITTNGTFAPVTPKNGSVFTADEIHAIVDGYLECLVLPDGRLMWLDEEGKLKGKLPNMAATLIALAVLQPGDVIVGTAVITTRIEAGEEDEQA